MPTITQGFLDHKIFQIVSETAAEQGVRAFVIGGYVRDCFLGRPSKDIDIVVEGSGIAIAEAVAQKVHSNVSVFRNFGTAMPQLLKGDFTASEIGHVKVCLDPAVPPFLLIETTEGKAYLLGSRTDGVVKEVYEVLHD